MAIYSAIGMVISGVSLNISSPLHFAKNQAAIDLDTI